MLCYYRRASEDCIAVSPEGHGLSRCDRSSQLHGLQFWALGMGMRSLDKQIDVHRDTEMDKEANADNRDH